MNAPQPWRRQPQLVFSPLAWLKLQHFCHAGDTEIGGFGITSKNDPLYVIDFVTVRQATTALTVAFADDAVADYIDRCVDAGLAPQNFLRVWCHTHPCSSANPSGIDEDNHLCPHRVRAEQEGSRDRPLRISSPEPSRRS